MIHCDRCQKPIATSNPIFAGYGIDPSGRRYCYACCGDMDRESLKVDSRAILYLHHNNLTDQHELDRPAWEIINWPGTLRMPAHVHTTIARHTIWQIRHDVWFVGPDGDHWYGRQQGDNDLVYCRRLKHQSPHLD